MKRGKSAWHEINIETDQAIFNIIHENHYFYPELSAFNVECDFYFQAIFNKLLNRLSWKNGRAIRGLFGEAEAVGSVFTRYADQVDDIQLQSVDDWVKTELSGDRLVQGIDAIFQVTKNGKISRLYLESKNWSAGCCEFDSLTTQFKKHMKSKVVPELDNIDDFTRRFNDGEVPNIEYDLRGSYFDQQTIDRFITEAKEICEKAEDFGALKDAGFSCTNNIVIRLGGELVHPLIN